MSKNGSIIDIKEILNDYSRDIQDSITDKAIEIAKNGVKKLKSTSPKTKRNTEHKGKYAKGWTVQTEKGTGYVNCTIHNKTDYRLTHLLENEHATHNGGKYVPKQKHITPVHDECCSAFEKETEKIIKEGG